MYKKRVMLSAMALAGSLAGAEMVRNGGFENGMADWTSPQRSGGRKAVHSIAPDTAYGKSCLKAIGDTANKYNGFLTLIQPLPQMEPGVSCIFRTKVKPQVADPAGKKFQVVIRQENAAKAGLGYTGFTVNLSGKEWTTLEMPFKPHKNAVSFKLYLISCKLGDADSVLVDDLSILPESEAFKTAGDELVRNGDFEKGISPWHCTQSAGQKNVHTLSNETKFGNACLRAMGDPANKYNGFMALTQPLPVLSKDVTYIFRAKARPAVKNPVGKEFKIVIRQANAANAGLGYTGFTLNLSEDTWRNFEMRFKPRKDAASFSIYILGSKLVANDAVYVDDVSLTPETEIAKPFKPEKKVNNPGKVLSQDGVSAKIDSKTGLLSTLSINGKVIQPEAESSSVVYVQTDGKEYALDGVNTPGAENAFAAKADYSFADGFFRETVTVTALKDFNAPVKIGVRHGFLQKDWKKIVGALRPVRVIPTTAKTIFSYGENHKDLTLGELDQYQHTAFPMAALENDEAYLLAGSRSLDDFVTLSPNIPAGYFPSVQQNPKTVKKGQTFRFELNWKLFPKSANRLRDLYRFYCDRLQTERKELQPYIPPRFTAPRTFYPGAFGSHTYFVKSREERLRPGTNVWFYSWHDNISERYPVSGSWWSAGNNWAKKLNAEELKKYVDYLQNEKKFNLIFYFRQLANLNQRGKEFPDNWYHRTPGGALHLYGGGYDVKLPPQVAKEVGYDKLPLGHYDFTNPKYRDFYHKEIFKALKFYQPRALGWDMGSDIYEFITIARTYDTIQQEKLPVKVTANESAGPSQPYTDMVLQENGLLGGKTAYDYEVVRAYTTAVVCLERFNIFGYAVDNYLTGKKTWLTAHGLAENKRYLDDLLKRRPELRSNRNKLVQLCQLRASLWDLAMGASPGYLEEAPPVPDALMRMAGDVNGLIGVNKSFALKFANGLDTCNRQSASAWMDGKALRIAIHNDDSKPAAITLSLDKKLFAGQGWTAGKIAKGKLFSVTPEGEKSAPFKVTEKGNDIVINANGEAFGSLLFFID